MPRSVGALEVAALMLAVVAFIPLLLTTVSPVLTYEWTPEKASSWEWTTNVTATNTVRLRNQGLLEATGYNAEIDLNAPISDCTYQQTGSKIPTTCLNPNPPEPICGITDYYYAHVRIDARICSNFPIEYQAAGARLEFEALD